TTSTRRVDLSTPRKSRRKLWAGVFPDDDSGPWYISPAEALNYLLPYFGERNVWSRRLDSAIDILEYKYSSVDLREFRNIVGHKYDRAIIRRVLVDSGPGDSGPFYGPHIVATDESRGAG